MLHTRRHIHHQAQKHGPARAMILKQVAAIDRAAAAFVGNHDNDAIPLDAESFLAVEACVDAVEYSIIHEDILNENEDSTQVVLIDHPIHDQVRRCVTAWPRLHATISLSDPNYSNLVHLASICETRLEAILTQYRTRLTSYLE